MAAAKTMTHDLPFEALLLTTELDRLRWEPGLSTEEL